jgi:hypothetical protein
MSLLSATLREYWEFRCLYLPCPLVSSRTALQSVSSSGPVHSVQLVALRWIAARTFAAPAEVGCITENKQ